MDKPQIAVVIMRLIGDPRSPHQLNLESRPKIRARIRTCHLKHGTLYRFHLFVPPVPRDPAWQLGQVHELGCGDLQQLATIESGIERLEAGGMFATLRLQEWV